MNENQSILTELIAAHQEEYETYFRMMLEWNEKMNLTSITERDEVYVKHFEDSLLVVELDEWAAVAKPGSRVVDVGTGAGFPGMPLAICHPHMQFVLCDSLRKRVQFLDAIKIELSLDNVLVVHGRAEDLARRADFRNQFEVVVSRAVARLNVLAEITLPFVKVDGYVFAYKGPNVVEEVVDGKRAMGRLGGRLDRIAEMSLAGGQGERTMVVMRQNYPTPQAFPRKSGTPQRNPL